MTKQTQTQCQLPYKRQDKVRKKINASSGILTLTLFHIQINLTSLSRLLLKQHTLNNFYISSTLVTLLPFEVHLKDSVGLHLFKMWVSMSPFFTSGRATSTNSKGMQSMLSSWRRKVISSPSRHTEMALYIFTSGGQSVFWNIRTCVKH